MHLPSTTRGILLMIGGAFSFSLMAICVKFLSRHLPSTEVVFLRSFLGALLLGFIMVRKRVSWKGQNQKLLIGRGVVGFCALSLFFWTLSQLDLGTAVMLNFTAPLFAVFLAFFILKERGSRSIYVAIGLSFIGVYLLAAPVWELKPLPLLAGLLSGLFAGLVHLLIRFSPPKEHPFLIIFYFLAISSVGSFLLLFKTGFVMPVGLDWLWILGVTLGAHFGQIGMTFSLKTAPIPVVSPFGYLTPVFGSLWGWFIWGELMTSKGLLGSAIIIACGIFLFRHSTKPILSPLQE